MRLFLDNEYDGHLGRLISMALVTEDGEHEFYEVVQGPTPTEAWVRDNVMPILGKDAIPYDEFQRRLRTFLKRFAGVLVIADYPEDIKLFMETLITGPGESMLDHVTAVCDDDLTCKKAEIRHNALSDARALRLDWLMKNGAFAQ